jgi:hypothetical protein
MGTFTLAALAGLILRLLQNKQELTEKKNEQRTP